MLDQPTTLTATKAPLSARQQFIITLVPVLLFTLAEHWGGLTWALLLSVAYAILEWSWEWWKYQKISGMSLFTNTMVIGLSGVSFYTQDGFWFKMQPAILELMMAGMLIGSWLMKRPMLVMMMHQQGHVLNIEMENFFSRLTLRMGFFFLFQAALATHAGLFWSTEAWAFLKSVGIILMMVLYMVVEVFLLRRRLARNS
jgi:intracellular septation protein